MPKQTQNSLLRATIIRLRAVWRIFLVVLLILGGLHMLRWRFPHWTRQQRGQAKQTWAQDLLKRLGVQTQVSGTAPPETALIVCNHISWLDIFVINAACTTDFVCKDDVRKWPVIGTLVTLSDAVYITRHSRNDAARTGQAIATRLRSRDRVAVFPEGSTSNGVTQLPFRPALFQAAIDAPCPVAPLALNYINEQGEQHVAPNYDGAITFGACLWAIACASHLQANLQFLELIEPGNERRSIATQAENQIIAARHHSTTH